MDDSGYERLAFEHREHGVLLIRLNRPEKYNAADEAMHRELARVFAEVSDDPQTWSQSSPEPVTRSPQVVISP